MAGPAPCRYCGQVHDDRYLCDPAAAVLAELHRRGASFTMPDITLPAPVPANELMTALGLERGDALLQQLVAYAGVVPVAGVSRPVLILSGRTPEGPLGRWVFPGTPGDIEDAVALISRMARLAIKTARGVRG